MALADACCGLREFDRAVEAYRHALTLIPLPLPRYVLYTHTERYMDCLLSVVESEVVLWFRAVTNT